ncbi:MAG: hydrogenase/urease maturation nickel metallochaperone HypA [Candidatus Micrarchaeota archaeon]
MHEVHAAQAILNTALKEAETRGAKKLKLITISLGEYSGIMAEQLEYWIPELAKETKAKGCKVLIKKEAGTECKLLEIGVE